MPTDADCISKKSCRISGFDVFFPHEPYGVQKVFMNQVLRAIDHEENALLEAPTGCGKTLSLLCGALAWQSAQKQKKAAAETAAAEKAAAEKAAAEKAAATEKKPDTGAKAPIVIDNSQDATPTKSAADTSCSDVDSPPDSSAAPVEPVVVPKIYYATRTHSQIAQVVRELKRTTYRPKMAVLGSRPHYCINNAVIRKGSIDAGCEELNRDGMGCKYKKNVNMIGHRMVQVHDIEDLARLGKRHQACPYFAARHLADSAELIFCPYSYLLDPNIRRSTKINATDAILIFDEAHNIEDQAREAGSVEVELETLKATYLSLNMAAHMSAEADTYEPLAEAVLKVIQWVLAVADPGTAGSGAQQPGAQGFKQSGFESFERIWNGQQMLSALEEAGLGPQEVERLWACYEKARAAEEKAGFNTEGEAGMEAVPSEVKSPRAGGNALGCVSSVLAGLRLMYGTYTEPSPAGANSAGAGAGAEGPAGLQPPVQYAPAGGDNVVDYRLAVQMWLPRDNQQRGRRDRREPDTSEASAAFSEVVGGAAATSWAFRLSLWCLNPAVIFRCLSGVARSVLLTSGTLSPLDSFSGELGLSFHVKLEAPHVVDMNRQVFARVVGHGPDNCKLRATYKEADKLDYQDSLGQLVMAVVQTVPNGVLMFLPSYALMDKLSKRWQITGLMAKLQQHKKVFSEPRQSGDAFEATIKQYYTAIDEGPGALFMAVCRGKVSEGIDFADGRARCVMVVGIPFPHAKDSKVALKKDYNNYTSSAAGRASSAARLLGGVQGSSGPPRLLTGDAWYSQQAFRALNQAIGRCIRHRLDYGAILLVDERFKEPRNQTSLSKWVRGAIKPSTSTQGLLQELSGFFRGLELNPPGSSMPQAAAAAAAGSFGTGQQQHPGLIKPGYEPEPGLPGPSAAGYKPGFEHFVAGHDADAGNDARSRWQQPAAMPASMKQQQHKPHQPDKLPQQQQRQGARRASGPMDAFLAKNTMKQQPSLQQQQQQQPPAKQEQQHRQPLVPGKQLQAWQVQQQGQQPGQCAAPKQPTPWVNQGPATGGCAGGPNQVNTSIYGQQQGHCQHQGLPVQPVQQEQQQAAGWQGQQMHMQQMLPLQVAPKQQEQQQQQQWGQSPLMPPPKPLQQQHPAVTPLPLQRAQQQHGHRSAAVSCLTALGGTPGEKCCTPYQPQHPEDQHLNQQQQQQNQQQQTFIRPPDATAGSGQHPNPALDGQLHASTAKVAGAATTGNASDGGTACWPGGSRAAAVTPQQSGSRQPTAVTPCGTSGVGTVVPGTPASASCERPSSPAGTTPCSNSTDVHDATAAVGAEGTAAEAPSTAAAVAATAAGMPGSTDNSAGQADLHAAAGGSREACAKQHAAPSAAGTADAPAGMTAGVTGAAAAGAAATCSCGASSSNTAMQGKAHSLGLCTDTLQQWVADDVEAMMRYLHQQVAAAQSGFGLQELACFGVMASFDKALEVCQQQQQSSSPTLEALWLSWKSHLPLGLLAVAAAAGQQPPQAATLQQWQAGQAQWQGPWLESMQQQSLVHNLDAMAELYDQVLEQQQQQPRGREGMLHSLAQQQQQIGPPGWQPHPPGQQQRQHEQYRHQQSWAPGQQQQPQRHHQHQEAGPQQQMQQQLHQHQQQKNQGQQLLHEVRLRHGNNNCSALPASSSTVAGATAKPSAGRGAAPGGVASGQSTAGKLQLSQSARQPKRAAVRSSKAQVAAQKRSKVAAAAAVGPHFAVDDSSDDDSDFLPRKKG